MYFQLPTVNTWKNHDVHYKKLHETTAPCIFVKTTKHKIAMPARTVSGPAGYFCKNPYQNFIIFIKMLCEGCDLESTCSSSQHLLSLLEINFGRPSTPRYHKAMQNGHVFFWSWDLHSWASLLESSLLLPGCDGGDDDYEKRRRSCWWEVGWREMPRQSKNVQPSQLIVMFCRLQHYPNNFGLWKLGNGLIQNNPIREKWIRMISGGLPSSQESRYKVTGLENNLHGTQGSKDWRILQWCCGKSGKIPPYY